RGRAGGSGLAPRRAIRPPSLRPRRDLDPRLRAALDGRVVRARRLAVIPELFGHNRLLLDVSGRLLDKHCRRIRVVRRRIVPPPWIWSPPPRAAADDHVMVRMSVAVEVAVGAAMTTPPSPPTTPRHLTPPQPHTPHRP